MNTFLESLLEDVPVTTSWQLVASLVGYIRGKKFVVYGNPSDKRDYLGCGNGPRVGASAGGKAAP